MVNTCFSEASAISVTLCTANLINVAYLISNRENVMQIQNSFAIVTMKVLQLCGL